MAALRYLLDENLRGPVWDALLKHNWVRPSEAVDVERVGDPADLPRGTLDPEILMWAEREDRVLLSHDKASLPGHLNDHLTGGHHVPGILIIPRGVRMKKLVPELILMAHANLPGEYIDQIVYVQV
jgi:hypothetical protein